MAFQVTIQGGLGPILQKKKGSFSNLIIKNKILLLIFKFVESFLKSTIRSLHGVSRSNYHTKLISVAMDKTYEINSFIS